MAGVISIFLSKNSLRIHKSADILSNNLFPRKMYLNFVLQLLNFVSFLNSYLISKNCIFLHLLYVFYMNIEEWRVKSIQRQDNI
jgi:hypothetical protein